MSIDLRPIGSNASITTPTTPSCAYTYAQRSQNSSSITSSAAGDQSCFTQAFETVKGWFLSIWNWIKECCCATGGASQTGQGQGAGQGGASAAAATGNTALSTGSTQQQQAVEPYTPEGCERKMKQMIQNVAARSMEYFRNPGKFDPNKEYCACIEFTLEAHRSLNKVDSISRNGVRTIWIKNGQVVEKATSESYIILEQNERAAEQVTGKMKLLIGEKLSNGRFKFYSANESWDSRVGSFSSSGGYEESMPLLRNDAIAYISLQGKKFIEAIETTT
jgi:hypothetical protein